MSVYFCRYLTYLVYFLTQLTKYYNIIVIKNISIMFVVVEQDVEIF